VTSETVVGPSEGIATERLDENRIEDGPSSKRPRVEAPPVVSHSSIETAIKRCGDEISSCFKWRQKRLCLANEQFLESGLRSSSSSIDDGTRMLEAQIAFETECTLKLRQSCNSYLSTASGMDKFFTWMDHFFESIARVSSVFLYASVLSRTALGNNAITAHAFDDNQKRHFLKLLDGENDAVRQCVEQLNHSVNG
jgi:hypothetical protein